MAEQEKTKSGKDAQQSSREPKLSKVAVAAGLCAGLMFVLLLCLCSCSRQAGSGADNAIDVGVMSFNIRTGTADDGENNWSKRRGLAFDVIRDYGADVVGLQEAVRFQKDDIREALPEYAEKGVGRDGATRWQPNCILYRSDRLEVDESDTFWFSDTPEVAGSSHWGNAYIRMCTWARFVEKSSGRTFYVYNLHLDNVSQPSREKSVELLVRRISNRKHNDPVIVTGDFNSGENNPVILYMKGEASLETAGTGESSNADGMVDTFRVLHPDAVDVGTCGGFGGRRNREKIDYIFAQAGTRVLDAQIVHTNDNGRYPSDHFPVTAKVLLDAKVKH